MNFGELLCAFAIIAVAVGVVGGSLRCPPWVLFVIATVICGMVYAFLLRQDHKWRKHRSKENADEDIDAKRRN